MNNWIRVPDFQDERGFMGVIENEMIPFQVKRVFWLANVTEGEVRGNHAHRSCQQLIVCTNGSVCIQIEKNGLREERVVSRGDAYLLETYTWLTLRDFSNDAVVLVLASESYDESEYVRSYDEFMAIDTQSIPYRL